MSETTVNQGVSAQNWNIKRDEIIQLLHELVMLLFKNVKQKRCMGSKRTQVSRALVYACSVELQALRDYQIEEMQREIQEIKEYVGMKK